MLILGTKALLRGRPKLSTRRVGPPERSNIPDRIARSAGNLGFFNREFRRRQQAQAEGRPFMPYAAVQSRLRRALVAVAAGDRPQIIARVFEDRPPDPQ